MEGSWEEEGEEKRRRKKKKKKEKKKNKQPPLIPCIRTVNEEKSATAPLPSESRLLVPPISPNTSVSMVCS